MTDSEEFLVLDDEAPKSVPERREQTNSWFERFGASLRGIRGGLVPSVTSLKDDTEISETMLDQPHSVVFDQAENRLHAEKAVLAELFGY